MDLRERLRLMRAAGRATTPPGTAGPAAPHPAPAAPAPPDPAPAAATLGGAVPGLLIPTPAGPAFCVETWWDLDHRHGRVPLGAALAASARGWARLGRHPAWAGQDAAAFAFLDTETTGLARGTGTYLFLIGVGRFVGGRFRIRQFFLRDYPEEEALLAAVVAELAPCGAVVTFNGRGYDWPLLQTRCLLHRVRLPDLPHLDLLYPARRLWRLQLENCRLADLEAQVLGAPRAGDVPGHLIPALYFDYLQRGEAAPLAAVLRHNRLDILALAALAGYLGQAAGDPLAAAPAGEPLPAPELHALGGLLLEGGDLAGAIACLEAALDRGLAGAARHRCQRLLAQAYRRAAAHHQAAAIWEQLAAEGPAPHLACIELAKHYEHRVRDLAAARAWTQRALEALWRRRSLLAAGARGHGAGPVADLDAQIAAVRHRLQRIEAKLRRRGLLG